jgi:RNA polymerase sigma-70 factor (ECF subfamily)
MGFEPDPDVALMLRVQRGDLRAFERLVEKYRQPVANLVFRMLGDANEAEDVSQTVFLQVYRSAHRYRVSAKFTTWLFTIARNLCLNELRRRARHGAESLEAPYAGSEDGRQATLGDASGGGPVEAMLEGELVEKIQEALLALPENQRMAILLCRDEELSYEAIASILGCSLTAVKSLIHRGRETLRRRLKAYLKSGEWQASSARPQL